MKHEHQWVKVSETRKYTKYSCGICSQIKREKHKFLPDISFTVNDYRNMILDACNHKDWVKYNQLLMDCNNLLGDEYKVDLKSLSPENLDLALVRYRRDYMA